MLLEHEGDYGLGMHGCKGQRMLLEHEKCYGPCALAARRTLWFVFVHGCNGNRMLAEHEGCYGPYALAA